MASTAHVVIRRRVALFFLLLTLLWGGLAVRLGYLQACQKDWLAERAQQQRSRFIPVEAKRGTIYDRAGRILAESVSALSVYAIPSEIADKDEAADKLAAVMAVDAKKIAERLSRRQAFVWAARRVDESVAEAVRALGLSGIGVSEESKRTYPYGEVGAHILGFAGADGQGLDGIELTMDRYLSGAGGHVTAEYDASGRTIPYATYRYDKPTAGQDVYLTIDLVLQQLAERELTRAITQTGAKSGSIILMEPNTGDILAMANRPTYDPNQFGAYEPSVWRNIAVANTYEPGSTFKVLTMAAALDEQVVTTEDRFFDGGEIEVQGRHIHCWKHGGHGSVSFREVVEGSCNVGFVSVGLRLGADRFYPYLHAFGLGRATGVLLPGEAEGIVIDEKRVVPLNLATMSMGQSIAVTPLQLITAVSAAVNGGRYHTPRIVREVIGSSEASQVSFGDEKNHRVISERTSQQVRELLEGVVTGGTGKNGGLEGYRVGGKTGTAQKVGDGGYMAGKYIASFVGFLPADAPKIVMLVVIDEPTGMYYGGQIAAPIFPLLMKDAAEYLGLERAEADVAVGEDETVGVIETVGLPVEDARAKLSAVGLVAAVEGEGTVTMQVPPAGSRVERKTRVLLYAE